MANSGSHAKHDHHLDAKMHQTREAIVDAAHKARDTMDDMREKMIREAKQRTHQAQAKVVDYTQKKPMAALGFAVLLGVGLSWLLRR